VIKNLSASSDLLSCPEKGTTFYPEDSFSIYARQHRIKKQCTLTLADNIMQSEMDEYKTMIGKPEGIC
jgi:hypothetical protein